MRLDTIHKTVNGKTYTSHLLRQAYRDNGRVRHRTVRLVRDEKALAEEAHLDGCYCLKTDLEKAEASKELVHDRYKDLAKVEWVFRTCKTVHIEVRPVNVCKETRTRGHVFVVMLAHLIVRELTKWPRQSPVGVPYSTRPLPAHRLLPWLGYRPSVNALGFLL